MNFLYFLDHSDMETCERKKKKKKKHTKKTPNHILSKSKKLHKRKTHTVGSSLLRKTTSPTAIPPNKAILNTKQPF